MKQQVYADVVLYLDDKGYVRWRPTTEEDLKQTEPTLKSWWKFW